MGLGDIGCMGQTKSFHIKILLLDKQELIQEVQGSTSGQDLLDSIYKYLNLIETAYFGLRYQDNTNQTHWLDPNKKVVKQIKVKLDILQGRLPVTTDLAVELAALALQSELGDYDPNLHNSGYVSEFRFFASQSEDIELKIEESHKKLTGLQPAQAENRYLEKVKWLDMYGVDLHPVVGDDNIEYFLGLTPSGIIVLRNRSKVGNYFWPRISKIYFKGKYFMLRVRDKNIKNVSIGVRCNKSKIIFANEPILKPKYNIKRKTDTHLQPNEESTYGFETPSRQACKHLWKCCVEHHAFFRLVQVSPSFTTTGVLNLGQRLRSSGRSEKSGSQEVQRRNPPNFTRAPSQRYSRRKSEGDPRSSSTSNLGPSAINSNGADLDVSKRNSLPRNTSFHQSLPPSLGQDRSSLMFDNRDLSLQSLQYLESRGLFGSRNRRMSEPDTSHTEPGIYRKRGSRRRGSDEESEASGVSMASGRRRGMPQGHESGSESESSRSARKNHRGVTSPDGRSAISQANIRKSGYINSGAETETELVNSLRRNKRRQRSRSRSPSEARARLPPELTKHFEYSLIEPSSPSLLQDIPYTQVETDKPIKVRYTQATERRTRHNSSGSMNARRKAVVETEERAMSLVQAPIFHRIQSSSTSSLVNNMATQQHQQQFPQQNSHQQQSRSMNHDALNTSSMSYNNHGHQDRKSERRMPRNDDSDRRMPRSHHEDPNQSINSSSASFQHTFGSQGGFPYGVTDSPRSSADRNSSVHGGSKSNSRPSSYHSTFQHNNSMQKSLDNHNLQMRGHENGPVSYGGNMGHNYSLPAYSAQHPGPPEYKHPFIQQHQQRTSFNSSPHSIQPSPRTVQPSPRTAQPSPRQNERPAAVIPNPSPRVPQGPASNRSYNQTYTNSPHLANRQPQNSHSQSGGNFNGQLQSPPPYSYAVSQGMTSRAAQPHSSLPPTQMSSVQDYRPVYNSMATSSPSVPKTTQRAALPPPQYMGGKNPGRLQNGHGGVHQNGVTDGLPGHNGKNWNNTVSMTPQGTISKGTKPRGVGGGYEPSGDEMSTEL